MFSFHVYMRPWSPKGEECARLISEAGHDYKVHVVRHGDDMKEVTRMARKQVSLPQVFEAISDSAEPFRIGGVTALRAWLKAYEMEETIIPSPVVEACYTRTQEGIEIAYYEMAHRYVMLAFHAAAQSRQLVLNMVAADRMRMTTANVWQIILKKLMAEAWNLESDSLPFYIASAASARFRLNSCAVVMDSAAEQVYNLLWVLDRWHQPKVVAYDPITEGNPWQNEGQRKTTTGQVILP